MSDPGHVHFIAIGGTGMGSLAGLLKARGIEVTGSDKALYPPMSTALERWGIAVHEGFAAEHVTEREPDLVVIGNAVRSDNPEARAAIDGGLAYRSFSDALYELAMADRHPVVVSGTHGKTSTTNITAALLAGTGRDPSLLVGGISLDFDGSFREGRGPHFVVEGDEYDTAFFDKTPKFLHYHPKTLILTSVEFDHADIYRDLEHVMTAFRELVRSMPEDGVIVAAGGDVNVLAVLEDAPCRVVTYSASAERGAGQARIDAIDWTARIESADASGTRFVIDGPGAETAEALVPMYGRINVENALAAVVTVHELGVGLDESLPALAAVRGVKRRQELRGEVRGVAVIDDFAHHPTAVRESIGALRMRHPGRRLIAVFEPRTNTSRRAIFQDDYARSFDSADHVVLRRVADEPIYSATGEVTERLSADTLARAIRDRGTPSEVFDEVDAIVSHLRGFTREGDVLLVMSNGSFDGIFDKLLEALKG